MNDDTTRIHLSAPDDMDRILEIHRDAFGAEEGPVIANLVQKMLAEPASHPLLSMVAEKEKRRLGHVLVTAAKLDSCENARARILTPLAITHDQHGLAIGSELVKSGLAHLQQDAIDLAFLLGNPEFSSRCGFVPAGMRGFEPPYPMLPENAGTWMVRETSPGRSSEWRATFAARKRWINRCIGTNKSRCGQPPATHPSRRFTL